MNSEKSVRRLIGLKISCNFSWDFFSKFSGILGFRIEKFGEFLEISLEISRDFADYFDFVQICTGIGISYFSQSVRRLLELFTPRIFQLAAHLNFVFEVYP